MQAINCFCSKTPDSVILVPLSICFKIMTRYRGGFFPRIRAIIPATRYTCVVLPRILVSFPALWGFYSQVYDHFLTNVHIYAHKKVHIYALQTSMWYMGSHAIIPATRYTCVFLSRILAFYSQVYDHFLTNAHIYAHKKAHIYALQTSMWYMGSQKVVV